MSNGSAGDDAIKRKRLYIPVAGTWARRKFRKDAWYRTGSLFDDKLASLGYTRVDQNRDVQRPDSGFWSGDVGGLLAQQLGLWRSHDGVWQEGGRNLETFISRRFSELSEAEEVVIIAHSHGGQVVAYALDLVPDNLLPLQNFRVITVDMPVRTGRFLGIFPRGMDDVYEPAVDAVNGKWDHLYSQRLWRRPWATRWRWLGSRFGPRRFKYARSNREIPAGHSKILSDPKLLRHWENILAGKPLKW